MKNTEINEVLVKELKNFVMNFDVNSQEIEEMLLVFMDEVFDSEPSKNCQEHHLISEYIGNLYQGLENENNDVLFEIVEYAIKMQGRLKFKLDQN